jgi:undecaprenyl-diphosphatase
LLGNAPTLAAVTLVSAVALARAGRSRELQLLLLGAVGVQVLTIGLKLGFERERPFFADPLATESTYSFPSGHASVSLAVYGTLGFILARILADRRARIASLAAAALLVGLIGVHFFTDVVAGFSVGLAWVALCAVLLHLHVRLRARRQTSL